jgi:TonB family protein
MRDAVGEELARRWSEPWPWRSALGIAVALHVGLAALLAVAPTHGRRALQLPSVQVRMVTPAAASLPVRHAAGTPAASPRTAPAPSRPATRKAAPPAAKPPRRSATPGAKTVAVPTAAPAPVAAGPQAGDAAAPDGGAAGMRSPGGGIALGGGANGAEEPFPFTYYLDRFISGVESNWYRPPAPAETRCRVRCRIDRTGRLLEAGIEEASGVAAFDRAALRAVYAATPFPPLPQGFSGQALTVHLDFGPQ